MVVAAFLRVCHALDRLITTSLGRLQCDRAARASLSPQNRLCRGVGAPMSSRRTITLRYVWCYKLPMLTVRIDFFLEGFAQIWTCFQVDDAVKAWPRTSSTHSYKDESVKTSKALFSMIKSSQSYGSHRSSRQPGWLSSYIPSTHVVDVKEGDSFVRVCAHCGTSKTPLWRNGPGGPKVLISRYPWDSSYVLIA